MKKISLLGSTGSIGTQTLDVIRLNKEKFSVEAMACGNNIELFSKQIEEFNPKLVAISSEEGAKELSRRFPNIHVAYGQDGLIEVATFDESNLLVNSVMGMKGMIPTYEAIRAGKEVALANKETLVAAGEIIMAEARNNQVRILPIDSEHSAIFQCLQGKSNKIKRIILTASGGPFRNYSLEQLNNVTLEDALNHPNWSMGKKITIDSATMMNKGLEVIEAKWLFDVTLDDIQVHVHPQSIVHSAVEFEDCSIIAQMGMPDMKVPISYAVTYPDRIYCGGQSLDLFTKGANLTFEPVDLNIFKCLKFAYEASRHGKSYPALLNGANEQLVEEFLNGRIRFIEIQETLEEILEEHNPIDIKTVDDVVSIDRIARKRVMEILKER